ncbi:nitroreductase [Megamonas hypermegale]|uniref:nitroreductase n=1 Tax=Megamonas hypermegale TaxID=158847 RepID=UPI0026EA8AF8|nr:nitroreductase [Megamonas hypermegale]
MNDVIKAMLERRSCRKYKPEQIKDEDLQQILEAGKYAATGHGWQSPKMVVIQNPEIIAKLSKWNAQIMGVKSDPFYGAPTVILVLADATKPTAVQDGSLVMGNLMLAAHSLGLGSCWINRAKEEFATEEGKVLLKQWGIEGDYIGVGHCVLGYPDGNLPKAAPRKDDYVVTVK